VLAAALVAVVAMLIVRAVSKNRLEYQRFKRFERTRNRQRMMRRWLITSLTMFGVSAAVVLLLAWRAVPLLLAAVDSLPPAHWLAGLVSATGELIPIGFLILAAVIAIGMVVTLLLARTSSEIPTIGDISSLLPRNRAELCIGAALSVNAGLVEELLFRLAIPALIFGASGSAVAAVVLSVLLFGGLHVYQGLTGMIGATVIGAFLMLLYLASGAIVLPIIVHVLIDLRSLVLIPVLVYRVDRVTARRRSSDLNTRAIGWSPR